MRMLCVKTAVLMDLCKHGLTWKYLLFKLWRRKICKRYFDFL